IPFVDPYTTTVRSVGAPFNVAANHNQPVWIDFNIPESTTSGTYSGIITVTASGVSNIIIPVTLTVWNFVLPDMRSVTTHFKMSEGTLIWYHRNTYDCSGNNCWLSYSPYARTVVKRYEELAHTHRIDTAQTFLPDPGNGCNPPGDWSAYDAALQPYMNGSYWSDGVPSSRIETPFTPGADWGYEQNCTPAQYISLAQAWASHLKAMGWFTSTIVYALDEPDDAYLPDIAQDSQRLQAGDAAWKARIMDTTDPTPSDVSTLNPALGIYCVALKRYDQWNFDGGTPANEIPYGRSNWPSLFAQNIQLWFYESNAQSAPYPTFASNTLWGVEPRIMLWGSWFEQATGFLYWDTTEWTVSQPWGFNDSFGKSGDGVLIYPGNHDGTQAPIGAPGDVAIDGPVPSHRLKAIRAGLQDWALFNLAAQLGYGTYARDQVSQVYGQLGRCEWSGCPALVNGQFLWLNDPTLMEQVRHNIAMKILGLNNNAPNMPSHSVPAHTASNVFTIQPLMWHGGDPDGQSVTYTVAFGTSITPSVVATVTQALYAPMMITNTMYYWRVTATDGISSTIGPVWQFTTIANERRAYLPIVLKQ
ncbi:MAG TPA: glycoside hydrolase domain-containing protein, partial [Anaerolineae bacterium]